MLSFIDFLKKYSTIPNQFLDDFFKLFNYESNNTTEKIVNANNVIKWLEIHKHNLKKTLKKSYIKDVDYIINKTQKLKGIGGQKNEIIMITIDCFKMICQSTQSKKGKEVRRYFIEVEKLLNKYKSYVIEGLESKISILEKGRKPKLKPQKGIIYVFRTPDTPENNLYKIGRTIDLKKRLQSHSSGLSEDINIMLIHEVDDVVKIEKCAKEAMKKFQFRKYKEVYQVNIDVIKFVIENCDKFHTILDKIIEKENANKLEKKKIFMYIDKK